MKNARTPSAERGRGRYGVLHRPVGQYVESTLSWAMRPSGGGGRPRSGAQPAAHPLGIGRQGTGRLDEVEQGPREACRVVAVREVPRSREDLEAAPRDPL